MTTPELRHARELIVDRLLDCVALIDVLDGEHLEPVALAVDVLATRLEQEATRP